MLEQVRSECDSIGLTIAAATASDLRDESQVTSPVRNVQWLLDQLSSLGKLIEREMSGRLFIYVSPDRARFLLRGDERSPFGNDVNDSFPSAQYDSVEAACCLAFMRSTGAVFHLMGVMEIALASLGSVFNVSTAHTNWAPAIDQIEKKIREMHRDQAWSQVPDLKNKQEDYSQAISTFGVLKDAWRNYTMHVRGKYTEEEAEHIFNNTKFFMQRLRALGLKDS